MFVHQLNKTSEDIAMAKLEIRRFQPPHSGLQQTPPNISIFILLETRVIGLHFCRWQHESVFVTSYAIIFESQTLWVKNCRPKTDFDMK